MFVIENRLMVIGEQLNTISLVINKRKYKVYNEH
jgi:hypothetical protein